MKTIATCVEEIIISRPFLEEALRLKIINYSALAETLQPSIEKTLEKSIKTGAIMMALRRYNPPSKLIKAPNKMNEIFQELGNITLQSNLSDYTFFNSKTLIDCHTNTLKKIRTEKQLFYTLTKGIHESNVIISKSYQHLIDTFYHEETCSSVQHNLSAISLNLPKQNTKITGLYYHFFKRLAWEGIPVYEVISTTNEFTIIVEDDYVDVAFSVIKKLKNIQF